MGFFDIFKKKDHKTITVTERKQNTLQETAAVAAFAEAGEHATALNMINQAAYGKTILAIGREDTFSPMLSAYTLDMAQRLGFEVLALNIMPIPLALTTAKREEEAETFRNKSSKNIAALQAKAAERGITFAHLVEIGDQDAVVDRLHAKFPGMRYVLTDPDPEISQSVRGKVSIPVFDLSSYHGAIA
ncbi:MAG: hypothetical protein PHI06_08525 [Desulfobulbaceae bacterium]|nr:hypothetical protein [Desulfobulbaceae bacterium]